MKIFSRSFLSVMALSLASIAPASAAWKIDGEQSALHFLSTKNAQVTEVHEFHSVSGSVSDSGELSVSVSLESVDTAIDIRNQRMKEILFRIADFPAATFTADLPEAMTTLSPGQTTSGTVKGTLSLHGEAVPVSFKVRASRLSDTSMVVSTIAPSLIRAKSFELVDGLMELQNIAGLNSITTTVPVTFSVVLTNQ